MLRGGLGGGPFGLAPDQGPKLPVGGQGDPTAVHLGGGLLAPMPQQLLGERQVSLIGVEQDIDCEMAGQMGVEAFADLLLDETPQVPSQRWRLARHAVLAGKQRRAVGVAGQQRAVLRDMALEPGGEVVGQVEAKVGLVLDLRGRDGDLPEAAAAVADEVALDIEGGEIAEAQRMAQHDRQRERRLMQLRGAPTVMLAQRFIGDGEGPPGQCVQFRPVLVGREIGETILDTVGQSAMTGLDLLSQRDELRQDLGG